MTRLRSHLFPLIGVMVFLLVLLIFSKHVLGSHVVEKGRLWTYAAHGTAAPVEVWDLATDTLEATFVPRAGNGRGIAFDPTDGTIWTSTLLGFVGDGFIHKTLAEGGPDSHTIPDPGGVEGPGIGALDFDPDENVLWAAAYKPIDGQSLFYKIRPSDGAVLHTCSTPFRDTTALGNDTLAVARPEDLGGLKVLLTDAGGAFKSLLAIDVDTCAVVKTYTLRVAVIGIDVDEATGDLIAVEYIANGPRTIWNLGPAPYRERRRRASIAVQAFTEDISLETMLRTVAVDAGHGRKCPTQTWEGVQGPTFGDREDVLALQMAFGLVPELESRARRGILTRTTECVIEFGDRVQEARKAEVDSFVSIHLNSGPPTAHGTEVWYWVNHPRAAESQSLAQLLVSAQEGLGLTNRGVKRAGIDPPWVTRIPFVLRETEMPAALSEVAFIKNSELAPGQTITDEQRLHDPAFLQQVAQVMADAIDQYFRQ